MSIYQENKLQGIPKGKNKTQFEETEQEPEPDVAGKLEKSDSRFKII